MVKVSVICPIKNEKGTILTLVSRVSYVMNKNYGKQWELILVDDASKDGSTEILNKIEGTSKNLVIAHHKKSSGQTGCFKTGFEIANGDIVVTIDGDLQMPPEDIPRFVKKIDAGYDVINAIREHRKHPFWIKVASRIYNVLMLLLFDSPVLDAASNFTAFRSRYVKGLPLKNNDHRYIIPITMRRGAKRIGELIVEHKGRLTGKSKYGAIGKYLRGAPEIILAFFKIKFGNYDRK
jgi:glycosyltransferase involved in cell wall biosynthesis